MALTYEFEKEKIVAYIKEKFEYKAIMYKYEHEIIKLLNLEESCAE